MIANTRAIGFSKRVESQGRRAAAALESGPALLLPTSTPAEPGLRGYTENKANPLIRSWRFGVLKLAEWHPELD